MSKKTKKNNKDNKVNKPQDKTEQISAREVFSPNIVGMIADEVAKTMVVRLPHLIPSPKRSRKKRAKKNRQSNYP